ncbi:hypothetical protein ACFYY3_02735 [Streptomyces sp. NPDC001812]|uniref:hypothetical protein n=1 Tax=unclassified Streptomyces TaxID=2593676 RepID=UPI003663E035
MAESSSPPSPVDAAYVEPSAEEVLRPGLKIGDLFRRNMTQPYVLQRLSERAGRVQYFHYDTVFHVGDQGVPVMDALEGIHHDITRASAHTGFLANFFGTVSREATDALRPKYGRLYGFEEATVPNAEMVAWAMYEYRGGRLP